MKGMTKHTNEAPAMDTTTITTATTAPAKAPKMAIHYDQQTCGRCGGSGRYSYNTMHGSTCYGCAGTGTRDTRDGNRARVAVHAKRAELYGRAIEDVQVGDQVKMPGRALFSAD